jgi:hypothetical protein
MNESVITIEFHQVQKLFFLVVKSVPCTRRTLYLRNIIICILLALTEVSARSIKKIIMFSGHLLLYIIATALMIHTYTSLDTSGGLKIEFQIRRKVYAVSQTVSH